MIKYPYPLINIEKKYELPNDLVDEHNKYVGYKLTDYTKLTANEKQELTDLTNLLYPYNICASDWNKFQEITENLQKFITIDMVNYINSTYFSMGDVENKISQFIDVFKNGEMVDILKECLKRWGGGDYMGKEMIAIKRRTLTTTEPNFTYTNENGGMLELALHGSATTSTNPPHISLIVDNKVIINDDTIRNYGIPVEDGSENGTFLFKIPFLKDVSIILTGNKDMRLHGFAYINPTKII